MNNELVSSVQYHTISKTTICVLVLKSGYEVHGVYFGELSPELAQAQAYSTALQQLFKLEEYVTYYTKG